MDRLLVLGLLYFSLKLHFKLVFWILPNQVHRVLLDIVSSAANATPGLGRYPPFKREVAIRCIICIYGLLSLNHLSNILNL